ncbi:hypothetical protein AwDysgo_04900 [Bacteroidales bacterium]|nr:hypothetical protein AwDysgo_04900 [Bacteroidales bacterium]
MKYNSQEKLLILPEYGRNLQNMVDHCITVEDAQERKHCANTIINIMGNMFPHLRDVNDFKHILWDHLAIMADFKLDIEYPYEIVKKEDLYARPPRLPYDQKGMSSRLYGRNLENMVKIAAEYPEGAERDQLIGLLASHMKKTILAWNKDLADDARIFKDLAELSKGAIIWNQEIPVVAETKEYASRRNHKNFPKRK